MIFLADTFIVQIYNFSAYVMSNSFENCICSVNLLPLVPGKFFNIKLRVCHYSSDYACVIIHRIARNKRNLNRLPRITHGF